jgi:hypothetical protein
MPKIEIEVPQCQYDILNDVAKKVGISAEKLIAQEVSETLDNVCAWCERGSML